VQRVEGGIAARGALPAIGRKLRRRPPPRKLDEGFSGELPTTLQLAEVATVETCKARVQQPQGADRSGRDRDR